MTTRLAHTGVTSRVETDVHRNPIPCNPWLYLDPCNPCYSYQGNPTDGVAFDASPIYSDVSSNVRHSIRLLLSVALGYSILPGLDRAVGMRAAIGRWLRKLRLVLWAHVVVLNRSDRPVSPKHQ
jgi:hypothetical protein